ncbi:hypothetical protein PS833_06296 [Pseudomonas fluorescens]|uniref:Calcineurin-like phosphoesterase domain-containing protein n=1 Tax=Pseudomonas fluorescens TaxID=294 RepID=A0A5E7FZN5_PSEFL|nr:hypothetical protein PS833_06296 [Pseudomonas fluorescens]
MRSDWLEHALEPKMKVGVISDTHGLLRAEAVAALEGCERIIHAGDIGKLEILIVLGSGDRMRTPMGC